MHPLIITTLVGLFLRLATLRTQGSGWLDELFSVHFASLPGFSGLMPLVFDVHPPLYAKLLDLWFVPFGSGLFQARLLSVLLGVAAIPAMWWMLQEAGASMRARRIGSLVIAVSPVLLYHSAEARMYPLLILLALCASALYFRMLRVGTPKVVLQWAVVAAAMLLTHMTAVVPFAVMAGWGIARTRRARRTRFVWTCMIAAAPFFAWLLVSGAARLGSLGTEWQFSDARVPAPAGVLVSFFAHGALTWAVPVLAVVLLGFIFFALFDVRREGVDWRLSSRMNETLFVLVLFASAPFLLALPFGTATVKYHFVALPAAVGLVALGFDRVLGTPSKRKHGIAVVALLLLLAAPLLSLLTEKRIRWDEAFAFVATNERSGDALYLPWFASELPARAYYDGNLHVIAGYPYDENLSFEERLVRHAGQIRTTPEMLQRLGASLMSASRVFVVGGSGDAVNDPVARMFAERGWRLERVFPGDQWTPTVLLYAKSSY